MEQVDVPKTIRQSVSNLDGDLFNKIKKFDAMFSKLSHSNMFLKVIDSYCSGLYLEATNKFHHVSYLEYYKVVEILTNKEFKRNTIAKDETTMLLLLSRIVYWEKGGTK